MPPASTTPVPGPVGGATAGLGGLANATASVGQSANRAQQDIAELGRSIVSLKDVLVAGGLFRLGEHLLDTTVKWVATGQSKAAQLRDEAVRMQHQLELSRLQATSARDSLEALRTRGGVSQDQLDLEEMLVSEMDRQVQATEKSARWVALKAEAYGRLQGPLLASGVLLGILAKRYKETLGYVVDMNRHLEQANTSLEVRNRIAYAGLQVMRMSGVEQGEIAEASRALVNYRLEESTSLKSNLDIMTKMNVAIGVHYETSAKLAAVYERSLFRGVSAVADTVARIAASTSIAAEKAAQYAFHIARSVRLLGPGMRMESERITEVVANLGGRIQELGGDADTVLQLFQQMTSGTAQGMFMRGMAGSPAARLGTEGGAIDALEGTARAMRAIVSADPAKQTELYLFQLSMAGEVFGMTAHQVRDLLDSVDQLNKPLNQQQTLEKAFRDQMRLTARSVEQLSNAWKALRNEAVMPFLRGIRPLIDGFTRFLRLLAGSPTALNATLVILTATVASAVVSIGFLITRIAQLATTSGIAASVMGGIRGSMAGRIGVGLAGGLLKWAVLPVLALSIGAAVGTALRKWGMTLGLDTIANILSRWYFGWKETTTPTYTPAQRLARGTSPIQALTEAAQAGARGQIEEMKKAFAKGISTGDMTREQGIAWLETQMPRYAAAYQLEQRYSRLSLPDEEARRRDKAIVDGWKEAMQELYGDDLRTISDRAKKGHLLRERQLMLQEAAEHDKFTDTLFRLTPGVKPDSKASYQTQPGSWGNWGAFGP